jgi:glutamine synthetase type III
VEAIKRFTDPKNVALFGTHGVFTPEECAARQEVRTYTLWITLFSLLTRSANPPGAAEPLHRHG